jgi:CheY-like chemotaxis protein
MIDRIPKLAVIQTEGCSPMVTAWEKGLDEAAPVEQPDSLITVLATGSPGMAYTILKRANDANGGTMAAVSDGEAFRAMRHIARLEGLSMEPAASVAFAGLEKLIDSGRIQPDESVVVNCSGHTFSAEKYALEDRYILNLALASPTEVRPAEGLVTALEELDEKITTIVIIDDNPYDSRLVRRLLQNYKPYRIFEANDPHDGLALVRERLPDLVLLDLMMPDMDGFAVLDELKADPRTAKVPVVVVSAKTLKPSEFERLRHYDAPVLQKGSFSARELATHVVEIVERRKHTQSHIVSETAMLTGTPEGPVAMFGQGARLRILVVDDYEPEARLIRRLLETQQRFEVVEAHSGKEALSRIDETSPDMIILDLLLPDISGENLLVMLRMREDTANVPVIVVTSQDDLPPETRARIASNVDSIWSKSVLDRSSFLAHIEALLPE